MNDQSLSDLLNFEPPTAQPRGWETAEAQAFRFPQRYVAKCQEFNDFARGLEAVEKEKNQLFDFVVRNLIAAMDTLHFVFEQIGSDTGEQAAASDAGAAEAATEVVATEPAGGEDGPHDGDEPHAATEDPPDMELVAPEANLRDESAITRRALESVRRSIMNILEGLHIEPVDLLGQTYRGVEVNGRIIEDPFEIVEARNQGKATELPVLEVITSLWVQTEPGVRIIRKGQVIC